MQQERIDILGIGIDPVDMQSSLHRIEEFIAEGVPRVVVTADASGIIAAQSDSQWRKIMENADLVTPDSVGVVWASEKVGEPLKERVSGVDLLDKICELSASKGYRLYFLGAAPGVADKAAECLSGKYRGAQIVGVRDGFFGKGDEAGIAAAIRDANVDVLFVAMGIPKQEKFIVEHLYEMNAKVSMGVGGSFDVLSGNVKRAPQFVQKLRMEWFWRLMKNPSKWRQVATLPKFWWLVTRTAGRRREA